MAPLHEDPLTTAVAIREVVKQVLGVVREPCLVKAALSLSILKVPLNLVLKDNRWFRSKLAQMAEFAA
jgi:hypothetical protein